MRLAVSHILTKEGFQLRWKNGHFIRRYLYSYPPPVWGVYPEALKRKLIDNLSFIYGIHRPLQDRKISEILFSGRQPEAESSYLRNIFYSLPFDAAMIKQPTVEYFRRLINTKLTYLRNTRPDGNQPPKINLNNKSAVIPFTFGKDSLLTFALCRELGIKTKLLFFIEPKETYAFKHKKEMTADFEKEFKIKIGFVNNPAGDLRDTSAGGGWFGWELLLTSFNLLSLPFAFKHRAKYILFANEASCNESAKSADGFNYNPAYEQSEIWTRELSIINRSVSGLPITVASLIGSLNDLAIIKILHSRYPEIGKYQISCFADRKEAKSKRWCTACSKCARIYILLLANGVEPKSLGYENDMLSVKYRHLYSIFGEKTGQEGYDATDIGREEQLLSFLLAYKHGARGDLMSEFIDRFFGWVKNKENLLRRKFYSIQPSGVIPAEYKAKVNRIFKQSLDR